MNETYRSEKRRSCVCSGLTVSHPLAKLLVKIVKHQQEPDRWVDRDEATARASR